MSKSLPYDLCWLLKTCWDEHPKNAGRQYRITGQDLREAKLFLSADDTMPEQADVKARIARYLASDFEGWKQHDWPLWGLLKHWNTYSPPRVMVTAGRRQTCYRCGGDHRGDVCPESKPASEEVRKEALDAIKKMGDSMKL